MAAPRASPATTALRSSAARAPAWAEEPPPPPIYVHVPRYAGMSQEDALTFTFGRPEVPRGVAAFVVHPALPPPGVPLDWFGTNPHSLAWERAWRACRRDLGRHRLVHRISPNTLRRELARLVKHWRRLEPQAAPLRAGIAHEEERARTCSLDAARNQADAYLLGKSLAPIEAEQDGLVLAMKRIVSQGVSSRAARTIIEAADDAG